jgi:hypothetical protein
MIWFFTRGAAQIDVEVHRAPEPGVYTLAVTYPDGAERIERFETAARLVAGALAVQQRLIDDGWMPASPATGRTMTPRRRPGRHARFAAAAVRRARRAGLAFVHVQRTIRRRLAAAFGL